MSVVLQQLRWLVAVILQLRFVTFAPRFVKNVLKFVISMNTSIVKTVLMSAEDVLKNAEKWLHN
jgi:hypothetical protein|tara:strand:- start:2903 stop:3094 length:192 start_codon:yes stop_codon:yes gene_type:complete